MPHRRWLALVFAILASCAGVLSNVAAQTTPPAPVTTQFILSGNGTFGVSIKMPANYYTCQLSADATFSATLQLYIARSTSYVAAGTGTLTGGPSLIQYQPQYMTQFEVSVTSYASGSAFVTATCVQTFANISYLTAPINITSLPPVAISPIPLPVVCGTAVQFCGPTPAAVVTPPIPVVCATAVSFCGPTPNPTYTFPAFPWSVTCLVSPCGFPTPIPTGTPYPAPTTSPAATWSPFPGALSELAGPSTAPAASAGQYLACVNSSGQVCVHDTTPVQPSPLYTQPVTTPAPCSTVTCQTVAWVTGLPNPLPVTTPAPGSTNFNLCSNASTNCATFPVPTNSPQALQTLIPNIPYFFNGTQLQPVASNAPLPVTTAAPIPYAQSTASPQPQQTTVPTNGYQFALSGGKWYPLGVTSTSGTSDSLAISQCTGTISACAFPTGAPADATTNTTVVVPGLTFPLLFNGTSWDRARAASPSPAPVGVTAVGYGAGGADAPIICRSPASPAPAATSTAGPPATLVVALSAGKQIYVCNASLSLTIATATSAPVTAQYVYGTKTTNDCDTGQKPIGPKLQLVSSATSVYWTLGSGVGQVLNVPAGNSLCILITGANAIVNGSATYEQFFHAVLLHRYDLIVKGWHVYRVKRGPP